MGGLSKKAYQYKTIRKESALPSLTIDGGGLLFSSTHLSKTVLPQAKITAEGIVEAYNLMGYDAVGITSKDLAAGIDYLAELAGKAKFSWLSANIVNKKSGNPVFKPFLSLELGQQKAAVIGLTNIDPDAIREIGGNNEIRSWESVLPTVFSSLGPDHDFVVLLTDLPPTVLKEIAKTYPQIRLVIKATGSGSNLQPEKINSNALLCATGKQGKQIGIMTVDLKSSGVWGESSNKTLADKKRELNRVTLQLNRYKNRPELLQRYKILVTQSEKLRAEIAIMEKGLADDQSNPAEKSTFSNRFIAMDIALPDDQPVLTVVNQIKNTISTLGKANTVQKDGASLLANYTGWRRCGECHQSQFKTWQNSRHASAYLTLINKNQQFDQKCVFCHVTGITREMASNALALPPELQHVGCESCHGPGANHAKNPAGEKLTPITEKTCAQCHVPAHDDDFKFKRDLDKLHCRSAITESS